MITRPSTAEWIDALKMRGLPGNYANQRLDWIPGSRNLVWDRTVTRGGCRVIASRWTHRSRRRSNDASAAGTVALAAGRQMEHAGIENLTLESEFDAANLRDEEHPG